MGWKRFLWELTIRWRRLSNRFSLIAKKTSFVLGPSSFGKSLFANR